MKKRIGMLIAVVCAAFLIAAAAGKDAKAESLGAANQPDQVVSAPSSGKIKAASSMSIDSLTTTDVGVEFNDGTYEKQVQLLNRSGKVIKTDTCYTYTTFSLSKNTVYYVRYREMDYDYASGQTYYSSWSGKLGFCTAKFKLSLIRKGRKVKYKAPKVAGVKSFRIYVSTKSGSNYKKVKTLKPGKSFKIKKFRGKKIKKYKNYYWFATAKVNGSYVRCLSGYWWVY